jgi:hypothetical protein
MSAINFYYPEMEYCQAFLCLAVSVTLKTEEKIMRNVHSQNSKSNLHTLKQNIFLIQRQVSIQFQIFIKSMMLHLKLHMQYYLTCNEHALTVN